MVDYFDANAANGAATGTDAAATTNGAAQPAANGGDDLGMDEILVGDLAFHTLYTCANSRLSER